MPGLKLECGEVAVARDDGGVEHHSRRAVVLGAGIGGLACAIALAQRSWDVTVLERAPKLGEVGAGISLWPGAMAVLEELGVAEHFQGEAAVNEQAGLRQRGGRMLIGAPDRMAGPVMVHRARLHAALVERLGADRVRTGVVGTEVVENGAIENAAGATVRTEDRREFEADLVIGADGLRSVTRSALHPSYGPIRHAGYVAYRGIAPRTVSSSGETWGAGARFGYAPLHGGRTYWYATANGARPARAGGATGGDDWADAMTLVAGWHDPLPELVAATPKESVLSNDVFDLPTPLPAFGSGHAALLGDAAHAMTPNLGQGACAAIEDAAALASALDERATIPDAVALYDSVRRPATQRLLARSRLVGRVGQVEQRGLVAGRDALLWVVGRIARLGLSPW